jgi:hypothetical protein
MSHKDHALRQFDDLIRRGRDLRGAPPDAGAELRIWQRDCAALVNELSGGSKAHWLSRAYSGAFLVGIGRGSDPRLTPGAVVVEVTSGDIVDRIVDVLVQGRAAVAAVDPMEPAAPPPARRFDFVRNPQLRPVLEQAFAEAARAYEDGDYPRAFHTWSGMLEAIITDALEDRRASGDASLDGVGGWSFDARIRAAEAAGLIRGGCTRLPASARRYRDSPTIAGGEDVGEKDAKLVRQVLHVTLRDLDPGR